MIQQYENCVFHYIHPFCETLTKNYKLKKKIYRELVKTFYFFILSTVAVQIDQLKFKY